MTVETAIWLDGKVRIFRIPIMINVGIVVGFLQYFTPSYMNIPALQPTKWGWDLTSISLMCGFVSFAALAFLAGIPRFLGAKRLWETGDWANIVSRMRHAMYSWFLLSAVSVLGLWFDEVAAILWVMLIWAMLSSLESGLWFHALLKVLETPQKILNEVQEVVLKPNPNPVLKD